VESGSADWKRIDKMLRVGLTGGIATGKSYCRECFARLGADTIDADVLAREVVARGTPGFDAVVRRFGRSVLTEAGDLDRPALGKIVFADESARRDLEAIIHPEVYRGIQEWMADLSRRPEPGVVAIADIPLLFETNRQSDFDVVAVAACAPERQLERLVKRGLSKEEAERRIAAQMPIDEKARRGTYVIETSGTFEDTNAQVERLWSVLKGLAAGRQ
jgi:dephospho-CoA kinase